MAKKKRMKRKSPPQPPLRAFLGRPLVQIGIVLAAVLVIWWLVFSTGKIGSGTPGNISVEEAYSMYQEGAFFLDVRETSEWNEYHAPGTTHIPLDDLAARIHELPKDRPIVVVCRSGNRSKKGRDILLEAGFTQVTSMDGGLNEWRSLGYPIEP